MQHQLCAWAEQTHGERLGQGHENFSLKANVFQCFFKKFCLPLHLCHKGQQRRRNTNLTSVSQMQDSAALPAWLPRGGTISNTRRKWTLAWQWKQEQKQTVKELADTSPVASPADECYRQVLMYTFSWGIRGGRAH